MNTAVTRNDWVGRVIDGRFPLLECIGSSEKAGVFRTELNEPGIRSAVIRLLPADVESPENRLRDWTSAANLSHPHLMSIIEYGQTRVGGEDLLYVVTEYAQESLSQVIPERPLSVGEAREMLVPILDALSYLHAQGLVHGHIKPSNVLVVDDRLKLPIESVRPAGRFSRPPEGLTIYDAPETAAGEFSPAADIWSLGVTLVEALTQNPPVWDRSVNKDPVVPSEIPPPFAQIARACLRSDPAKRYSQAQILDLLRERPSIEEPRNDIDQAPTAEVPAPARATGVRTGIIGAGFVVAIAVIAFLVIRSHPPAASAPPTVQSAPAPTQPSTPQAVPSTPQTPSEHEAAPPTPQPVQQTPPSTPAVAAPPPASAPDQQTSPSAGAAAGGDVSERVMPDVLASANRTIQGKVDVRIRLNVDANGTVSDASFDSQGPSRYYSGKALDAARKWRFKPAQANGQAVPSVWTLRFEFKRSGPEVSAQQVSP